MNCYNRCEWLFLSTQKGVGAEKKQKEWSEVNHFWDGWVPNLGWHTKDCIWLNGLEIVYALFYTHCVSTSIEWIAVGPDCMDTCQKKVLHQLSLLFFGIQNSSDNSRSCTLKFFLVDPHGSFLDTFHSFPPIFLRISYQKKKPLRMGGLQSFSLDSQFRSDFFCGGCLPLNGWFGNRFFWGVGGKLLFSGKIRVWRFVAGFHVGFFWGVVVLLYIILRGWVTFILGEMRTSQSLDSTGDLVKVSWKKPSNGSCFPVTKLFVNEVNQ